MQAWQLPYPAADGSPRQPGGQHKYFTAVPLWSYPESLETEAGSWGHRAAVGGGQAKTAVQQTQGAKIVRTRKLEIQEKLP